jgi:hypothetical protein
LSEEESNALHERWTIPSPARPLFEAAALSPPSPAKVDTANEDRRPLLLTMGGKDHTVPEAITKSTLKQYRHPDAVLSVEVAGAWGTTHQPVRACPRPGAAPPCLVRNPAQHN